MVHGSNGKSNSKSSVPAELQVIRNGRLISDLPAIELVPGDLVEIAAGDRIPADMRIITLKTATLRAEQSSLTGESVAVLKCTEAMAEEDCELQAKECMLFSATAISNGAATAVVASIGMDTEIGKIQSQIQVWICFRNTFSLHILLTSSVCKHLALLYCNQGGCFHLRTSSLVLASHFCLFLTEFLKF